MPDYANLQSLLTKRLEIIADTELRDKDPEQQLLQLQTTSESITQWHQDNRGNIPSQLNHFLQQSSLSKALDFLNSL